MEINFAAPSEPTAFEEHRDYRANLKWTITWIQENEADFPQGIRVMITSGQTSKEYLTFMFRPPLEWRGCGFASHLSIHQGENAYYAKVHNAYEYYKKMINFDFYNNIIR